MYEATFEIVVWQIPSILFRTPFVEYAQATWNGKGFRKYRLSNCVQFTPHYQLSKYRTMSLSWTFTTILGPVWRIKGAVSVSPTNQMPAFILIDSPQHSTRATRRQWHANVPHKCTLVRFFYKVNNFELMNNFSHWCTASSVEFSNAFLNIFHRFFFQ